MEVADKRLKVEFKVTDKISGHLEGTPIFDQLKEDFTQLYADEVLARKVDADINGNNEDKETTNGQGHATAVADVDRP